MSVYIFSTIFKFQIYIFFFNLFLPDYMCVCNFLLLLHFVYPYSILFYPLTGFMLSFIALIIWNILALLFSFSPIISKLWLLFARTDALFMTLFIHLCCDLFLTVSCLLVRLVFFPYWILSSFDYKRVALEWCYRFFKGNSGPGQLFLLISWTEDFSTQSVPFIHTWYHLRHRPQILISHRETFLLD